MRRVADYQVARLHDRGHGLRSHAADVDHIVAAQAGWQRHGEQESIHVVRRDGGQHAPRVGHQAGQMLDFLQQIGQRGRTGLGGPAAARGERSALRRR